MECYILLYLQRHCKKHPKMRYAITLSDKSAMDIYDTNKTMKHNKYPCKESILTKECSDAFRLCDKIGTCPQVEAHLKSGDEVPSFLCQNTIKQNKKVVIKS